MPYLTIKPKLELFYTIDDYTDPWTHPQTIVLVHGANENLEAWRGWIPHLSRRYRVVRIDQRGFGKSGAVADDFVYTDAIFVGDLAQVIAALGSEAVHLVGGKSGGFAVVKLAASHPELVRTVTLASTPVVPPKTGGWLKHMEEQGMASWVRSTMRARLGSKMPPQGIESWVELMGSTALSTMNAYLRWVATVDIRPDLARVKCPALFITTESPNRTQQEIETYRSKLANLEVVVLPVDGYHASGADPDNCARATLAFVDRWHAATDEL